MWMTAVHTQNYPGLFYGINDSTHIREVAPRNKGNNIFQLGKRMSCSIFCLKMIG
jgi:hypothetical protein